jgi:hypothetical protein
MRLILIRVAGRTLARLVSASAVRIALSATLTTPQPVVALQAVIDTPTAQTAPTVLPAEQTDGNGTAAAAGDKKTLMPGFVGPGFGWG